MNERKKKNKLIYVCVYYDMKNNLKHNELNKMIYHKFMCRNKNNQRHIFQIYILCKN